MTTDDSDFFWTAQTAEPTEDGFRPFNNSRKVGAGLILFSHIGFFESILICVSVVLVVLIAFSIAYFYFIRKLGCFSDNPRYKRRVHYNSNSTKYRKVSSASASASAREQKLAHTCFNAERRPRPSTLCLTTTTTSDGLLAPKKFSDNKPPLALDRKLSASVAQEPKSIMANSVGLSDEQNRADSLRRNPPAAQLSRKRVDIAEKATISELLVTASGSSSLPSTTTISDNSFVTAKSVYFTPTQGDWTIDVPLYRSSREWRYAYYSGLLPSLLPCYAFPRTAKASKTLFAPRAIV